MIIDIPGIDAEKGLKNSGSEETLIELFGDVYKIIDDRISEIEEYIRTNDIKNFTTKVHALKTTCRMMGAIDLGEDFYSLELLGKEENLVQIQISTPDVLASFKALKPYLEKYLPQKDAAGNDFNRDDVISALKLLISSIDDFDLGSAEKAMKKLSSYEFDDSISNSVKELEKLVSNLDYDEAKELTEEILGKL